jgi:hypothetical protein
MHMVIMALMSLMPSAADEVVVRGEVREAGSGRPLAGIEVHFFGAQVGRLDPVITDAKGRYEGRVPHGKIAPYVPKPPLPYLPSAIALQFGLKDSDGIPAGVAEHQFPPIELVVGRMIQGIVVRGDGQPVVAARVSASWVGNRSGGLFGSRGAVTSSDDRGRFEVGPLDPMSTARIRASVPGASTDGATDVEVGDTTPLRLVISEKNVVTASGRVVNESGEPIKGATVRLWSRVKSANSISSGLHQFEDGDIITDSDGRFRIPEPLRRDGEFQLQVSMNGKLNSESDWHIPGDTDEFKFPDLLLRREPGTRIITGRVVDANGLPVHQVAVSQSGGTSKQAPWLTDAQGLFKIIEAPEGNAFLIASKGGVLSGALVKQSEQEVTLVLGGDQPMVALEPIIPHEQALEIARELLEPYVKAVQAQSDDSEKFQMLTTLARVDPMRALELLEGGMLAGNELEDGVRCQAAIVLLHTAPDEALAVVETMRDPASRVQCLMRASDRLPVTERARTLGLLGRAVPEARACREPTGMNVVMLGQIAERWLDLGEKEKAEKLLLETAEEAKQLPNAAWSGYARGAFAEELAQINLPAALSLVELLSESRQRNRHYGNIAHELAAKSPADAERVLAMVDEPYSRDQSTGRVVYRMATVDLDRAKQVASKIEHPTLRAYAYGLMALAQAEHGASPSATALLDQAFDELAQAGIDKSKQNYDNTNSASVPAIAGALLPIAERIDPSSGRQYLWKAMALRPACKVGEPNDWADSQLALSVARYDRELAKALVEPLLGTQTSKLGRYPWDQRTLGSIAALVDPNWAVELIQAMPEDTDPKMLQPKNNARRRAALILSRTGDRLSRSILSELWLWVPDTEDHQLED